MGSVIIGAWSEIIISALRSGVSQEWLGFAGAILGSLMTIVAGVMAWFAAQRTIAANQVLSERRAHDTLIVIQRELSPKIEMFVAYWRVVQRALSRTSTNAVKTNGVVLIKSITEHGISDDWLDEIRRLGADISPVKRQELLDVVRGLRLVRDQIMREISDGERAHHFWLLSMRTMLSHFHRYLAILDPVLAKRFSGFTKSAIDHRELAEHIDPLIKDFEQTGNTA